jgi:hypothetical protein
MISIIFLVDVILGVTYVALLLIFAYVHIAVFIRHYAVFKHAFGLLFSILKNVLLFYNSIKT